MGNMIYLLVFSQFAMEAMAHKSYDSYIGSCNDHM